MLAVGGVIDFRLDSKPNDHKTLGARWTFSFFRLILGNRRLLVLLVFALLLQVVLIAFTPVSVQVWTQTLLLDKTIVMAVALLGAVWLTAQAVWRRTKYASLETSIKSLLGHGKEYVFAFDTAGEFKRSEQIELPERWGAMIRPKASVDKDYDTTCRAGMSQLDSYCFGQKTAPFRFAGANAATSRINLATTLRSAPRKDEGTGHTSFGYIETTRQGCEKARFLIATDESIAHPDLTTSVWSSFSVKADVPISLRQYVSPVGLDRYFHVHLLIPYRRKHVFAKWRIGPILMFIDDVTETPLGPVFERDRKILLGYGGQDT